MIENPLLDSLSQFIRHSTGLTPALQARLLLSLGILASLLLFQHFLARALTRRMKDAAARYGVRKTAGYLTVALSLILIGRLWSESFTTLSTFLGLVAGGLAIALREFFQNLAGWVYIAARRPFAVGERIQLGEIKGDVVDLRLLNFTVLELGNWVDADDATGRLLHIPNGQVFTKILANYDQALKHIWNELKVTFTFESDFEGAKALCASVLAEVAPDPAPLERRLAELSAKWVLPTGGVRPAVFTRVRETGIELTLRYPVEPRKRRESESRLWEALLARLAGRKDLELAYPTTRFFDRSREGGVDG